MDFDDGDGESKVAPKPSRFAPKSKFQPKPRPKPEPAASAAVQPNPEPSNDGGFPVSAKKEPESAQPTDPAKVQDWKPSNQKGPTSEPELIADDGEPMDLDSTNASIGEEQATLEKEEEDFVVSEYDVCFNPPPLDDGTQLFVFQYPLRSVWRPYELDEQCTEVRIKPACADLEVELSMDVDSENYEPDAPTAPLLTKQILSSTWWPYQRTGYAIGVVIGRKLHINPVSAVRQLRPSMGYLDPSESKKKNVSQVATKAASATVETSGKPNKLMDHKDVEPWIPLKYHGSSSNLSARYLQKMVPGGSSALTFSMKPNEYLDSLCPRAAINKMKPVGPSKRSLLSLPLDQRLRLWLVQGPPVHRFSALKHYAPDYPEADVLRVLEQYALLVQGHWVAKTPIRFPNAKGPFLLARDYVLLLFSQSATIKYSELDGIKLSRTVWKDVLGELAIERHKCKDWKFREPVDVSFIKLYPDIVEGQERKWKMNEEQMREKIGIKKNPTKPDISSKPYPSQLSDRSAVKSATGAGTMSNETREALPKVLRKLFQAHKVCSFQTICQGLRDMAVSKSSLPKAADAKAALAAAYGVDAPQEELVEIISEVAVNIHGVFVLKSSLEHPEHNPLRNVMIDLFIGKGPNAKVKRSEIFEAAKMQLQREPSNDEFRKVLSEFCVSNGSAWVLKSGDGAPK